MGRSGKTHLLFPTTKKIVESGGADANEILYVDLEYARLRGLSTVDLDDMEPKYIFLDELRFVKNPGDGSEKGSMQYIHCRSSSSLTPKRIAEELRGKCVNY